MIRVALNPPYDVHIGAGLLETVAANIPQTQLALISDTNVAAAYAEPLKRRLEACGKKVLLLTVAAGEDSKSFSTLESLLREMLRAGLDRKSAVLALGGGVVTDLAGFVAASFMRGIALYSLPTSLLAMVDASVGGKTGINVPEGKNLVGAFWQPQAVFMDVRVLKTLPESEFRGGAVELFKHGLLADSSILTDVQDSRFRRDGDEAFLSDLIERSVRVKADIVAQDERESGTRAFLNLGHTLAHALEAATDHRLSHGDAVAYGLLYMAILSAQRGYADERARLRDFLSWVSPAPLGISDFGVLEPYIARDKKHSAGVQTWVLLEGLQQPMLLNDISREERLRAWQAFLEEL